MSLNTPAFVIAFYGTLLAGGVVVPVNHKLTASEVDYILEHSRAAIFLFDGILNELAVNLTSPLQKWSLNSDVDGFERFDADWNAAPPLIPVKVDDDDPAEILYTSGTTGRPKGCIHSHRNVLVTAMTVAGITMKMDENDRVLLAMPIWHSSPLNHWFVGAHLVGADIVLQREYHPLHFLEAIQDKKCTVYFGAPISYILPTQMIPNFDEFDLSAVRCWIYGGGPISGDVVKELMKRYRSDEFYQVYGMTESGPTGAVLYPRDQIRKAGAIGQYGGVGADIKVMKNEFERAAKGEAGEIWMKADGMMSGYLNDEAATQQAFHDGWYRTGDVARIDDDGYLYLVDRLKDMIVTGGENVYSKEVEDAISSNPSVMESAVIGKPHPEWGETVVAFVVPKNDQDLSEAELVNYLAGVLAKFKIPREIYFRKELPHTPTGKVKKYELREQLGF